MVYSTGYDNLFKGKVSRDVERSLISMPLSLRWSRQLLNLDQLQHQKIARLRCCARCCRGLMFKVGSVRDKADLPTGAVVTSGSFVVNGGERTGNYASNGWDDEGSKGVAMLEGNQAALSAPAFLTDCKYHRYQASENVIARLIHPKLFLIRQSPHDAPNNSLLNVDLLHCASGSFDTPVYVWTVAVQEWWVWRCELYAWSDGGKGSVGSSALDTRNIAP
ncbi:hypothetical protein CVT26_007436 [Gymnopilus dilepis]|uniref:Uncharacterized protein n=1 Tax=Gymnopilus dilepis TaxID=231916 RepID=A0A409WIU6_9AGAR|nr:hypothetical protein CVT26_007436 [Gymnopilus dilepis]